MNNPNILFLPSWYPSRQHATIGNFVQRHALAVAQLIPVTVVAAFEASEPNVEIIEEGNLLEIRVYFKKKLPLFSYQKAMAKGIEKAMELKGKFDLAHVHVAYPAGILAYQMEIPYVVTEHFSGYHKQSGHKWGVGRKRITKRILNGAEKILPVSDHLGRAIVKFGCTTPYKKVSNVVDTEHFYPSDSKPERFTFLHISTLEERSKNITGILKGFKTLQDGGTDFLLKIGGDGDIKEFKSKIEVAGLKPENVRIFGEKSIQEISELMRSAHALVMFSHFENQPCTILEALCSGVPVVTSDVGGIPEVITEDNGILVEAENEAAFAVALQKMAANYSYYETKKIAEEASAIYSNTAVAHQLKDIYHDVLSQMTNT
ncbi:glycosyltransferase [Owenweeksia hongkongensis DSM 17368]|uniref:Glycosyltransferase n=1 Tax=Owenweeksia hongkongensis (strain DSM 17368 / CIP 108786 / JCM 12287 / NRRL B-23963 / UST20020801) TaxID=926562 RepID=G8R4H3_OWEHD|nr:glycosyltransferase [Owenweeksia hongkongensis]AEV32062.1 glycosyltransferase [Owenweeksia hongkongensis DSM 17368]